jgi:prolipoprotein diacylglyceryltransferase
LCRCTTDIDAIAQRSYTRSNLPTLFHPALHPLFEALGYAAGFAVYRRQRASRGDALTDDRRWAVIAAAAIGALVGARLLGLLEQAPRNGLHWADILRPGGKTIVGGLLGGWLAVELIKLLTGVRSRTGDLFAVPLCIGIAVGRLGCFFAGLADDTYGTPTTLPWAIDFGDGIPRHPTQLYEFLFLIVLAWLLSHLDAPTGSTPSPSVRNGSTLSQDARDGTAPSGPEARRYTSVGRSPTEAERDDLRAGGPTYTASYTGHVDALKKAHRPHPEGQIFRAFLAAYLLWRLAIDFLKPQPTMHGMNWIQWACIAGLVALGNLCVGL